jgi:thiol:disulfide interchange protein DsbC
MSRNPIFAAHLSYLLAAVLLIAGPAAIAADDAALEEVRAEISAKFDTISPEDINRSPIEGWYEIQKGSIVAYVSEDGRYLLQGDLIDLDSQVNLSEKSRNGARHELVAALSDEQTILFSPVDPKYKVTVFTDVDCTYCRKLHSQIEEYMANGIGVRYVLYPRNGPASGTWNTSQQVWCADDRGAALTAAKQGQTVESQSCDASMITQHYALGRDIGLSGTPAIVFEDGTMVGGYLPPAQLSQRLQQNAAN